MRRIQNRPKSAVDREVLSSPFFFIFNFLILLATDLLFPSCISRSRRVLIASSGRSLVPQYVSLSDRWVSGEAQQSLWVAAGEVACDGARPQQHLANVHPVCSRYLLVVCEHRGGTEGGRWRQLFVF